MKKDDVIFIRNNFKLLMTCVSPIDLQLIKKLKISNERTKKQRQSTVQLSIWISKNLLSSPHVYATHLVEKNIPIVEMHYPILEGALPSAFCSCNLFQIKCKKMWKI